MDDKEEIGEKNGIEEEDTSSDIETPFDPKEIDVVSRTMSLDLIFKRLRNNEIDLNTDFQRGTDLWDQTKQSQLIESILIRLPLPAFYFDGSDDNNWLVVDGLQRLSTFKNYVIDKKLKLRKMEYLTQFNGKDFDGLPRDLQRRIEESEITAYIINPGTPLRVRFDLFRRINTGGLTLNAQEIRHALHQGIPANFIKKLADLDEFVRYGISTKRMVDRNFVTRFVAFYIHEFEEYKPELEDFLNSAMVELKDIDDQRREQIKCDFKRALIATNDIFGEYAFRKIYNKNDKKKPLNKALFEVWTVQLSKLSDEEIEDIIKQKKYVIKQFMSLLNNDKEFETSISTWTGDKKQVEKRFGKIRALIESVLI